jgi:transcriptional regulator with GAF, ATPase, and Fis domain
MAPVRQYRYAAIHSAPAGGGDGSGNSESEIRCRFWPALQTATSWSSSVISMLSTVAITPRDENVSLREELDKASMFEEIVGISAALKKVLSRISKVAPTDSSVLITGETGTGKELVARAIHRRSPRSLQTFVSVTAAIVRLAGEYSGVTERDRAICHR